jgi:hypothetical protein
LEPGEAVEAGVAGRDGLRKAGFDAIEKMQFPLSDGDPLDEAAICFT